MARAVRIGEEGEDLGAGATDHHALLEDVIDHRLPLPWALAVEVRLGRAEPAPACQESFLTSARIRSGSGSSPRPYRSMKRMEPVVSMTKVARLFAFQSGA